MMPSSFGDLIQGFTGPEVMDANAWIYNTTFANYKVNYSNTNLSGCNSNNLFEVHPSADSSIGNHHFFNTTCTNCQVGSYGYFAPPIASNLGSEGGCGNILCTGRNNYLLYDHDGSLLGSTGGIIIPNNSIIGDKLSDCVSHPEINGHICNRTDIIRLKYSSIAGDFNSRIMWPVNLTYDDTKWTTITNAWKEYQYSGQKPLNKRMARFLSIVQLYKVYNMSFAAQPPSDMLFSFSLPTLDGDGTKWIGVKLYYPIANAISVTVNGAGVRSILSTSN